MKKTISTILIILCILAPAFSQAVAQEARTLNIAKSLDRSSHALQVTSDAIEDDAMDGLMPGDSSSSMLELAKKIRELEDKLDLLSLSLKENPSVSFDQETWANIRDPIVVFISLIAKLPPQMPLRSQQAFKKLGTSLREFVALTKPNSR